MKVIHTKLEEIILDRISLPGVVALFVAKKAAKAGISLTQSQIDSIREQIQTANTESSVRFQIAGHEEVILDYEQDSEELLAYAVQVADHIPEIFQETSVQLSLDFLRLSKQNARAKNRSRRAEYREFSKLLKQVWGKPLNKLQIMMHMCEEVGHFENADYKLSGHTDVLFDVLDYLQSRGCQIANEIMLLLQAGYADGAHARWRSLHELAVIAYFIKEHGPDMASRYLDHAQIQEYKKAMAFHSENPSMYDPAQLSIIISRYDSIKAKYQLGPDTNGKIKHPFLTEYGWATFVNDKGTRIYEPNFSMLEEYLSMNHLRGYYKEASENIHGSSIRMFTSLSVDETHQGPVLHTGPSINGFTTPLHSTAISLNQLTQALLSLDESLDNSVICLALKSISNEIGQACLKSEQILNTV